MKQAPHLSVHPSGMVSTAQRPQGNVLNVISIYEDFIGAVQACEAVEWLHHHFNGRIRVKHHAWSFASLTGTGLQASASQDWESCDLLIVSGHGNRRLPETVWKWFDECFQQHASGPAALVALFDFDSAPETFDGPFARDLRQIAWHRRLEFISNEEFEVRMNVDFCTKPAALKAEDYPGFQFLYRCGERAAEPCAASSSSQPA